MAAGTGRSGRARAWLAAACVAAFVVVGHVVYASGSIGTGDRTLVGEQVDRAGRLNLAETPGYVSGVCDAQTGSLTADRAPDGSETRRPNEVAMIGHSGRGEPIWVEHWGPTDAPQVIVVAQVHGYECSPIVFARIARLHDFRHVGVWLIPVLNPDGYSDFSRYNANRVDLNADGLHQSQPETQALMKLTAHVQPALTVHVHSPNGFVGWHANDVAERAAKAIGQATGLRFTTAGSRHNDRWFLWQGQRSVAPGTGSVLIELPPIVDWEARGAIHHAGRIDRTSLEQLSAAALTALDASFANP